ncbi:hypothetical protein EBB07_31925 [Paenibacillaceae bacterium]|nr:hypothetical protein EBB07_31925 [Paenibacillaceae bacterium]
MRRKQWGVITVTLIVMAAIFTLDSSITGYVDAVKQGSGLTAVKEVFISNDQTLRERIEAEAANRSIAPVDARVDRVWKAIPGYNGLEVDIEQSIAASNKLPDGNIQLVYREVEPRVHLDDLGRYPIYKGNPNKPMVALMINVAWGNEFLEPMLKVLKDEQVKATFFLDGSWLKKNADLARQIQAEGHEMSNHAYSHPDMSTLGRTEAYQQIARTEQLLKQELKVDNIWFAPPSGDYNQTTVEVAADQGLKTVLWTLDTLDWKKPSPESIVRKIAARVEPGTLILMHPTSSSSQALSGIIREIRRKGLQPDTVSSTLSPKRAAAVETAP